jgi:hypothetical protein
MFIDEVIAHKRVIDLIKNNIGNNVVLRVLNLADTDSKAKLTAYIQANLDKLCDKGLILTWKNILEERGNDYGGHDSGYSGGCYNGGFQGPYQFKRAMTPKHMTIGFNQPGVYGNNSMFSPFSTPKHGNLDNRMSRSQHLIQLNNSGNSSFSGLNNSNPYQKNHSNEKLGNRYKM